MKEERQPDWAEDFPAEGDVVIARMLQRDGQPDPTAACGPWHHYQVVERSTGLVVGGFGAPEDGVAEIGYGIVPSRRGRGYATEAVRALVSAGWKHRELHAVVADTELDNVASRRVLEKAGFVLEADSKGKRYRIDRSQ